MTDLKENKKPQKCFNVESCSTCATRIVFWSMAGSIFLSFLKLTGGVLSGSSGLLADGLQSISCFIGCLLLMFGLTLSRRKADNQFPYGYGKAEFLTALIVFSCLFALGFFISMFSILSMLKGDQQAPELGGLPVAVTSVFLNYVMYKYSMCAGKKLENTSLLANAYQNKADIFSSAGVCVGIVLSQFGTGFEIFDPIAAFVVGGVIMKDAAEHWFSNFKVIVDNSPEPGYKEKVMAVINEASSGLDATFIGIKRTGKKFWLNIELKCSDKDTIEKIELIKSRIRTMLRHKVQWMDKVEFFLQSPSKEQKTIDQE